MAQSGYELRTQIGNQLIAISGIETAITDADDTPVILNTRALIKKVRSLLTSVYNSIPASQDGISESVARSYNAANAEYKGLTSAYYEFSGERANSFGDALWQSVEELPQTLKTAGGYVGQVAGDVAGGVSAFSLETIKKTIGGFFAGLGWFGWLLLGLVGIAALFYFFPELFLVVKKAL